MPQLDLNPCGMDMWVGGLQTEALLLPVQMLISNNLRRNISFNDHVPTACDFLLQKAVIWVIHYSSIANFQSVLGQSPAKNSYVYHELLQFEKENCLKYVYILNIISFSANPNTCLCLAKGNGNNSSSNLVPNIGIFYWYRNKVRPLPNSVTHVK